MIIGATAVRPIRWLICLIAPIVTTLWRCTALIVIASFWWIISSARAASIAIFPIALEFISFTGWTVTSTKTLLPFVLTAGVAIAISATISVLILTSETLIITVSVAVSFTITWPIALSAPLVTVSSIIMLFLVMSVGVMNGCWLAISKTSMRGVLIVLIEKCCTYLLCLLSLSTRELARSLSRLL